MNIIKHLQFVNRENYIPSDLSVLKVFKFSSISIKIYLRFAKLNHSEIF